MASIRTWPLLAVALWTTTCMQRARPDAFTASLVRESLAPISLVTADGVELELLSIEAKALLVEPLAFTELHLRFRNPEQRVLEGRFRVVLPPSASVARFAMKVRDRWEEAELVELTQARESYEMFLHRRQDPALLEQSASNEFSARIFPIAPKEEKELILGYSEDLVQPDQPYRIALKGIHTGAEAEVTLLEPGAQGTKQRKVTVPVTQDFELPLAGGERLLRRGELVVGRVTVPGVTAQAPMRSLAVLIDTSASRALGLRRQVELLRGILAEARRGGVDFNLRVLAFDQETFDVYDGPAKDFGDTQERSLLGRGALGASNLELALRMLDQRLAGKPAEHVLVIGDGVTTAGALDGASLARLVASLAKRGAKRLDAIVVGGVQDEARLTSLTTGGLAESGAVLNGGRPAAWLWSRLTRQATRGLSAPAVEGAVWSWPRQLRGVLPGDSVMTIASLASAKSRSATPNIIEVDTSLRPLLERAAARARVAEIEEQLDQTPATAEADLDALKSRLIEASTDARVLCRLTGFVVLENESAWERTSLTVAPSKLLSLDAKGLHAISHERPRAGCCGPQPRMVNQAREIAPLSGRKQMARRRSPEPEDEEAGGDFRDPTIVLDDSISVPQGLKDLARKEAEEAPRTPTWGSPAPAKNNVESPPPPSEPATVSDSTQGVGLPELPPEPEDALRGTLPDIKAAGSPQQKRQPELPKPPHYDSADFDKLPRAYTGQFGEIMSLLAHGKAERARTQAEAWRAVDPGQTLALVALGEACRATGDLRRAARAFGSIIDLFPARADLRRFAAGRLASLQERSALDLAIDSAWRAVEQRPDQPSGHHLLATFLLEAGRFEQAFAVLTQALDINFDRRYLAADRILREDAALVAKAWAKSDPSRKEDELWRRLARLGARLEDGPSLRFVLTWESDANDVDFHVRDGEGYHAFYAKPVLPTGGQLYADVRDGYGPECFTVREPAATRAYPYRLSIRYARRGPMGYGMGTLQIIEHDGHGKLRFGHRPFVIMNDGGYLELAEVQPPR